MADFVFERNFVHFVSCVINDNSEVLTEQYLVHFLSCNRPYSCSQSWPGTTCSLEQRLIQGVFSIANYIILISFCLVQI